MCAQIADTAVDGACHRDGETATTPGPSRTIQFVTPSIRSGLLSKTTKRSACSSRPATSTTNASLRDVFRGARAYSNITPNTDKSDTWQPDAAQMSSQCLFQQAKRLYKTSGSREALCRAYVLLMATSATKLIELPPDLNVNEYCHFCARTFEAYKYMKHHCIKTGPENQIQYTTARITALRTLSKTELEGELRSNHRYMNNSPLASKQIDSRSPPDTDSASTTVSSSSPPPEAPQPSIGDGIGTTASLDLQYSRQTASLPINGEGYNSQGFPPLFWPLDSSEEVQFPAPLWTIWPESTQAGVWSLNRGPLESAVNFRAQARTIADPTESPHDV